MNKVKYSPPDLISELCDLYVGILNLVFLVPEQIDCPLVLLAQTLDLSSQVGQVLHNASVLKRCLLQGRIKYRVRVGRKYLQAFVGYDFGRSIMFANVLCQFCQIGTAKAESGRQPS